MSTSTPTLRRLTWKDLASSVIGMAVAALLIIYGLPTILGASWAKIGSQLARVGPGEIALMAALLLAGLFCYTWVLIGSLPGLRHVQALKINAVTSFVANVLPLGAAVGVALTVMMQRSWGFRRRAVSASLVVTGIWNVLARIALPVVGCLVIVLSPMAAPRIVVHGSLIAAAVGIALIVVTALMVVSDPAARAVIRGLDRIAGLVHRSGSRVRALEHLINDQRERVDTIVRSGWIRMSLGMIGMFVLLFGLYWCAARSVGVEVPLYSLICAYTFRQLLTLVGITPGGLGVTEVGTAGLLVLLGATPGAASATALLYAVFAHVVVVPFGLAALTAWWFGPDRAALTAGDAGDRPDEDGASGTVQDGTTAPSDQDSSRAI